jgi:hypothetical protein
MRRPSQDIAEMKMNTLLLKKREYRIFKHIVIDMGFVLSELVLISFGVDYGFNFGLSFSIGWIGVIYWSRIIDLIKNHK